MLQPEDTQKPEEPAGLPLSETPIEELLADLDEPNTYPRELSWLSFNARVLQEADDPGVPLIQRVRYLGIFSNNLDEFFPVSYTHLEPTRPY